MTRRARTPAEIRQIWLTLAAIALATTFIGLVSGCQALTAPQSFEDRWAYAMGVRTAVVDATASALAAGDISSAQARRVQELAGQARLILEAAHQASRLGDLREAEAQLELATRLLTELQAYLRRRGT